MLTPFGDMTLSHQPAFLFQHMLASQPGAATSFRRSVTSAVRSSASGGSDEVYESRIEESTGSGQKRVVIERGLGSKVMRLTQVSDGCGGTTEERLFTNVSKEEESMFDDSSWYQAASKRRLPAVPDAAAQTPSAAAVSSSRAADTSNIDSCNTLKAADAAAPTQAEHETDEQGVPIAASFEATDNGSFRETDSTSNASPALHVTDGRDNQHSKPQEQKQQQERQDKQQVQPRQQQCSSTRRRHGNIALHVDPFSRQLLSMQRLSSAFDPWDAWSFERPYLPHFCGFAPARDAFPAAIFRRPLIDVWG
jgi:hypothetical protein